MPTLQYSIQQQQQQQPQQKLLDATAAVSRAVIDSLSNSLLIGVLGFVDDMLEGLTSLVQIDFGFVNSRLHNTDGIGLLCTSLSCHMWETAVKSYLSRQRCKQVMT